ncbi:FUSC family protein [Halosquirtibacter xylanolyticus]|uniref:FUSC family membrane protein n=1 Tax=Halosquirtibacter xylanolyticus TaxID=3374599 RepID=UPI00374A2B78|nr:FUSC family protein [Prolixibacteraceae bacterium]
MKQIFTNNHLFKVIKNTFWYHPSKFFALKVTISMVILISIATLFKSAFFAISLTTGVLCTAISDGGEATNHHIRFTILNSMAYFIIGSIIELVSPHPIVFTVTFVILSFILAFLGGVNEIFKGITTGAILISIYAFLGLPHSSTWYEQPTLFAIGAFVFGSISYIFSYYNPYRKTEEHLSKAFFALSKYIEIRSSIRSIEANPQQLHEYESTLLYESQRCYILIKKSKRHLYEKSFLINKLNFFETVFGYIQIEVKKEDRSEDTKNQLIRGQFYILLSNLCKEQATSILEQTTHLQLERTFEIIQTFYITYHDILEKEPQDHKFRNIIEAFNLSESTKEDQSNLNGSNYRNYTISLKDQLLSIFTLNHSSLRYAVRLSLCFFIVCILIYAFSFPKGGWVILTSFFVCQPTINQTTEKIFERIIGSIIGILAGAALAFMAPTYAGQIFIMTTASYGFFIWLKRRYYIAVIFINIFTISGFSLLSELNDIIMITRIMNVVLGSIISFLIVRFIFHRWQSKDYISLLEQTSSINRRFLKESLYSIIHQQHDQNNSTRNRAMILDTILMNISRELIKEPSTKELETAMIFNQIFLNHTMLKNAIIIKNRVLQQYSESIKPIINETYQILFEESTTSSQTDWTIKINQLNTNVDNHRQNTSNNNDRIILYSLDNVISIFRQLKLNDHSNMM